MMEQLEALIAHPVFQEDKHVQELTELLVGIEGALIEKSITEIQYVELMVDVERFRTIIALKNNLELNRMIHDAVVKLIELAKLVKP
jgi:hypothetical protein